MSQLTAEDIHAKALQLKHHRWILETCENCDAPCQVFLFNGDQVYFDEGCRCQENCTSQPVLSSWKTVLTQLLLLREGPQKEEVDKFWKI